MERSSWLLLLRKSKKSCAPGSNPGPACCCPPWSGRAPSGGPSPEAPSLLCSAFHPPPVLEAWRGRRVSGRAKAPNQALFLPHTSTSPNPVCFLPEWLVSLPLPSPSALRPQEEPTGLSPGASLNSPSLARHQLDSCGLLPSATWAQNPPQGQSHLFPSLPTSIQPPRPRSGYAGQNP